MMASSLQCVIFLVSIFLAVPTEASLRSGLAVRGGRPKRSTQCTELQEYSNGNICCKNCPAGTYLVSPCTTPHTKGECRECEDGSYLEHPNNLHRCLKCTPCHPGQEIVSPCTHTSNTVCQCKPGRFCEPDQACEECRKCLKCEKDEEIVRNCTPTSNTECKKTQPQSGSSSEVITAVVVPVIVVIAVLLAVIAIVVRMKYRGGRQTNRPDRQKPGQSNTEEGRTGDRQRQGYRDLILSQKLVRPISKPPTEECRVLYESLPSSASNSQHSLTGSHIYVFTAPLPQPSPMVSRPPDEREDEPFPELVPVNGEESLRKCFELFEEMDIDYYRRFFRHLGISDNVIKSKDSLSYDDRLHELLNIWVEKEGLEASLNDLLKELLALNQRRTAENIKENAIRNGHYKHKEEEDVFP